MTGRIIDYALVKVASTPDGPDESKVNALIQDWWQPHGSPVIYGGNLLQAWVLTEKMATERDAERGARQRKPEPDSKPMAKEYSYEEMRHTVFTEDGAKNLLNILARCRRYHQDTFEMGSICCCSWQEMACVDFLVETNYLEEIKLQDYTPGQLRKFKRLK